MKEKFVKYKSKNDGTIIVGGPEINIEFWELQNKIDSLLTVGNGKYEYNEDEVRNLIISEHFDFDKFNAEMGTEYTEDSFITMVLNDIKNAVVYNSVSSRGTYCNRNHYGDGGWNYNRAFNDNTRSGEVADGAEEAARNFGLGGSISAITGLIPYIGTYIALTMGLVGGFGAWYFDTLAASVRKNMSGCGTVVDINKYTTAFTVWDQRNFYE